MLRALSGVDPNQTPTLTTLWSCTCSVQPLPWGPLSPTYSAFQRVHRGDCGCDLPSSLIAASVIMQCPIVPYVTHAQPRPVPRTLRGGLLLRHPRCLCQRCFLMPLPTSPWMPPGTQDKMSLPISWATQRTGGRNMRNPVVPAAGLAALCI